MSTDRQFAEFMKGLRERAGLSSEEAASLLGITCEILLGWENGNRLPPENLVQQISQVYSISEKEWLEVLSAEKRKPHID